MRIMKKRTGGKGAFGIWLVALASIFVVMLIYVIFNQVFYSSYGLIEIVNASFNETPNVNLTEPLRTMMIIQQVWTYFPLVAIIGILMWGFAKSLAGGTTGGQREYV